MRRPSVERLWGDLSLAKLRSPTLLCNLLQRHAYALQQSRGAIFKPRIGTIPQDQGFNAQCFRCRRQELGQLVRRLLAQIARVSQYQ
ncbi:hypothetical protein D3C80_1833180 [compost metagenome]